MRRVIKIDINDAIPSMEDVLLSQGIHRREDTDKRILDIARESISIYKEKSKPMGIIMEITKSGFEIVYQGNGGNEEETPLEKIYKTSDDLALFAVTIGENISKQTTYLFEDNEYPVGSMLDSAASNGTEMAAGIVESHYLDYLKKTDRFQRTKRMLRFSPGYCGWHISAQEKLFEILRPGEIGISLRDSFLMEPLKSISGVIIAGRREIFDFDDTFPFCGDCNTHSCRDRLKELQQ